MSKQQNKLNKRTFLVSAAILWSMALAVMPCLGAGLLQPVNGQASDVTMRSHDVTVTINNGFVRTEVDQIFWNDGNVETEAVYSFPIPKQASLSELSLWINGKEVIGEVLEKERAREIYRQETQKKVDPALAEKNEYKSFDISVYPLLPKAETRLRLVYYQPIEIDSNIGRYVYPLSEGGRDEEAGQATFWSTDRQVHGGFNFNLTLKSAFTIADVRLPGYEDIASVADKGNDVTEVAITQEQGHLLDRDIVFYYRLDETAPARVELIPYRADKSAVGTFMLVVTPAGDLQANNAGTDWVFVLDTSGSMRGSRISMLAEGIGDILSELGEKDRFRIVAFSQKARDVTGGYMDVTPENVIEAQNKLGSLKANGSTELFTGLKEAYDELDKKRTSAVILVTDGITQINTEQHDGFLRLLESYDVRLFTFLLGNGGDRPLMERLAQDSGGFAMQISESDDMTGRVLQAKTHIMHENMRDVEIDFDGANVINVTPEINRPIYRGEQLVVFGQYEKAGKVSIEMTAKVGGQERSWHCKAELPEVDLDNPELERLWALSSIADVTEIIRDEGETEPLRREVIELGTEFSLVTDYTSMLVLEEHRYKELGIDRKNQRRVTNERMAQEKRRQQPTRNYRVDRKSTPEQPGTFNNRRSPGVGSGPVGPVFLAVVMWLKRRKR